MAKVYKKDIDVFIPHENEDGEMVFYVGQIVLQQLLSFLGININALSKEIGWSRPDGLYRVRDGLTKTISGEVATDIYRRYNWVDLFWLITGEGQMHKNIEVIGNEDNKPGANSGSPDQDPNTFLESISKKQRELAAEIDAFLKASSGRPSKSGNQLKGVKDRRQRLHGTAGETGNSDKEKETET
ncbi:MAG TPA: hypothetical protein PL085_11660 [Agriterribacter sp.]|uniref:hypothetical protein n=1 Tax=Agriterribacter sp. TaxID=2821509 RepID=UPI002BF10861|nr:hypothetical protein [Agriterribacter sp.]HRQ17725.1 hypothetical protein [Agriterribacter sp.]